MNHILADTNIISEIMRPKPNPAVAAWFRSLDGVSISIVTVEEIISGLRRKQFLEKEAWFRRFIAEAVRVLPLDAEAAIWTGEMRGRLAATGTTVTQADACIAATAWRHGLVLATRNTRDFELFGIPLLNPFPAT
jgi:predicted nucleic acid-binding protein